MQVNSSDSCKLVCRNLTLTHSAIHVNKRHSPLHTTPISQDEQRQRFRPLFASNPHWHLQFCRIQSQDLALTALLRSPQACNIKIANYPVPNGDDDWAVYKLHRADELSVITTPNPQSRMFLPDVPFVTTCITYSHHVTQLTATTTWIWTKSL